jgi:hypothetical protein
MAKKVKSLRKGRVFKDFKDRREFQTPLTQDDFPDPPHYELMPEDVKNKMKQDFNLLTRAQVDALLSINRQYIKQYNILQNKKQK